MRTRLRLLTRAAGLLAIGLVSLCSLIFFRQSPVPGRSSFKASLIAFLQSSPTKTDKPFTWGDSPKRLIVFGDSWNDNGQYPIDPPSKHDSPPHDAGRGKVWTEWLCSVISCTHHDNFARSLPHPWVPGLRGSVVDSKTLKQTISEDIVLNSSIADTDLSAEPLPDLKDQVQQWLRFERQQYGKVRSQDALKRCTVFIVWYSLWDIWYYSKGGPDVAQAAVINTTDSLFRQLDIVSENWAHELKVIIPGAIDLTYLPGWHTKRTGLQGTDFHADEQRSAIAMVQQWNRALGVRASRWIKGEMYIYDTNAWLLDQVLAQQLSKEQINDANGLGSGNPTWEVVDKGCLARTESKNNISYAGQTSTRCTDPTTHLFWDDFHLGPEAMKNIGETIANDISEKHGSTWFPRDPDD